jgi:hypothetical protein
LLTSSSSQFVRLFHSPFSYLGPYILINIFLSKISRACSSFVRQRPCFRSIRHYRLLKTIKLIKAAPICFGSRRNHHQGDMTSTWIKLQVLFNCACRYRRCQCHGGICRIFLSEPKHIGADFISLFLTVQRFYISEYISWAIKQLIL